MGILNSSAKMSTPVNPAFLGIWQQYEIINAKELAASLGVPAEKCDMAVQMMQVMTLQVSQDGDHVNMKTTTPAGSREAKVKPGEESEYTTSTGMKMRTCPKELSETKITQILKDESGVNVIGELVSEITDNGELYSTMTIKGITSIRKFKKKE